MGAMESQDFKLAEGACLLLGLTEFVSRDSLENCPLAQTCI